MGKEVDGRPMTADDIYYNQYQITKSIVFKNMEPFAVCTKPDSYLYEELTKVVVVDNASN